MDIQHKTLTAERWGKFSFMEQLGNVSSELHRASVRQKEGGEAFAKAVYRALELMDLTIQDPRWRGRLKELARMREAIADAMYGGKTYGSTFESLDRYFFPFAFAARLKK